MTSKIKITLNADDVKNISDKDGKKQLEINGIESAQLFDQIIDDELLDGFLSDDKVKTYIAKKIGVEGLLVAFPKEEVLGKVGWPFVSGFFKDHMDRVDILNEIGWEAVKSHFADKINQVSSQNAINTAGTSVLGALDELEGKA
jgi:hypothetical protein